MNHTAYLITDEGKILGTLVRTPRKIKKRLKKLGEYSGKRIVGFEINMFFQ